MCGKSSQGKGRSPACVREPREKSPRGLRSTGASYINGSPLLPPPPSPSDRSTAFGIVSSLSRSLAARWRWRGRAPVWRTPTGFTRQRPTLDSVDLRTRRPPV